ncbi:hypothetical protein [Methylobacterium sp.]|uniref:hypothetical protein n=1 Tax=Methylobacterium sp. TaxID=409 RepID=UPI0026136C9D|nr:hypothetical protein [Methylobacterium sp.]MDB5647424.1 hypothetical protein [Methylobacterium sp.]
MTDEDPLLVLSVASLTGVQMIDGGDTLAMRFRKPGDRELVLLVPRQVALALQPQVSEVLAQPHDPHRSGR